MDAELRNWAENYCYGANRIATAASTAKAQEYVTNQAWPHMAASELRRFAKRNSHVDT
jgi:hypothetical protein